MFIDEFGRETPVLSNDTGTLVMDKANSANQNRFDINFQVGSQFPPNMKYMKFFVKETSGEYYNLAMGRWYDAEDGNIWLSFPSTDRAKLDEESFIILKKGSDNNDPVTEPARYKVIAIENDAPDYIKTVKIKIGSAVHSYISGSGTDVFGTSMTTAPGIGDDSFEMMYQPFSSSNLSDLYKIMREAPLDKVYVDFEMATIANGKVSDRYRVVEITTDFVPDAAPGDAGYVPVGQARYYLKIKGQFGSDINFICDDPSGLSATQINEGAKINIYRYKVENLPQFDGRFFAKILNDDVFRKYVSSTYSSTTDSYKIVSAREVFGFGQNVLNKHGYQYIYDTWQGQTNPTPEISAFLYNYNGDGNDVISMGGNTVNHGPSLFGLGAGFREHPTAIGQPWNAGGSLDNMLYGEHEHIRYPNKNRYQAWFNKFRFFDATDHSNASGNADIGSRGIQWGAQHADSQHSPIPGLGTFTGFNHLGGALMGDTPSLWFNIPKGLSGLNNPYGFTFEIGEDETRGYMDPVDFNNQGTCWFIDGGGHVGYKSANNNLDGSGGVQLTCSGASTASGGANAPLTSPGSGFWNGSLSNAGSGTAPGGTGNPGGTASGCWFKETGSSTTNFRNYNVNSLYGNFHSNSFGRSDVAGTPVPGSHFSLKLAFGGIYDDDWANSYNAAGPQYYGKTGFFDLRNGGNPFHPNEKDFIDHLAPGTRWRWAEDPEQTVYVIGENVEEYGTMRYCLLPHLAMQTDMSINQGGEEWNIIGWGNPGWDAPFAAAQRGAGYNAVNGFTNPANFTKNFFFTNEDPNNNFGKNWNPVRDSYSWGSTTNDIINNDGFDITITAAAAGATSANTITNLDNYYIIVDSIIGTNIGGGASTIAIHKGLVLFTVGSGLNDAGIIEPSAPNFGVAAAAINLAPNIVNNNYPTAPGTFWEDYTNTPGSTVVLKNQALLVKEVVFDSATSKYHIYLTGYRRTMTKYDTITPDVGTSLKFLQPQLNGFSKNFVENFHWMAWKWNSEGRGPWNPANFQAPNKAIEQTGSNSERHFQHGSGFNIGEYPNEDVRLFDAVSYTLEILEPSIDGETYTDDPAIWETEPKETTDLNIYYEASGYNPMRLDATTKYTAIPTGSSIQRDVASGLMINTTTTIIGGISDNEIQVSDPVNGTNSICVDPLGCPTVGLVQTNIGDKLNITRLDGSVMTVTVTGFPGATTVILGETFTDRVQVNNLLYNEIYSLNWHNCYSYGNGVESNRIRDYFNLPFISNGVFASTTLGEQYKEERRTTGLIYSGLYNSISGINNLNQFIQAEKITKDVNPSYGSIQKLHARDTDLVTLCEDKVLRILSNKDAVFNADGNTQLTATENVLGQTIPFVGEYGISTNPESFASESYRAYFSDKVRGAVLRLSKDGLTPISDHGMKDWFKDNLKNTTSVFGSYDDNKDQYNITLMSPLPGSSSSSPFRSSRMLFNNIPVDSCSINTYTTNTVTVPDPGVVHNLNTWLAYYTEPYNGLSANHIQDFKFEYFSTYCDTAVHPVYGPCCEVDNSPPSTYYHQMTHFNFGWYPGGTDDCTGPGPVGSQVCGCNTGPNGLANYGSQKAPWMGPPEFPGGYFTWDYILTNTMANLPLAGVTMSTNLADYITLIINYFVSLNGPTDPIPHLEVCTQGGACYCEALPPPPPPPNGGIMCCGCVNGEGTYYNPSNNSDPTDCNDPNFQATGADWPDIGYWYNSVEATDGVICGGLLDADPNTGLDADGNIVFSSSWSCDGSPPPPPPPNEDDPIILEGKTLTFKENVKGWTSFKSFTPEHAVSCANEYFTFNQGNLYQHHHPTPPRNNFYGQQYHSSFNLLMNDGAGSVKNFKTINYEGSQSRIRRYTTQSVTDAYGTTTVYDDKEYYNLISKPGWWVQKVKTDLQQGSVPEFIDKEGKWFNYIKGPFFNDWTMPQFDEFAAQGIGGFENFNPDVEILGCMDNNDMVNYNPNANIPCVDANGDPNGTAGPPYICCEPCVYGCMDASSSAYDPLATCDDGSCEVPGCTDPTAVNYNPLANVDDGSCVLPSCGCMDANQVLGENASMGNGGGPTGVLVDEYLNYDPLANCDCDCDCTPGNDTSCCNPAIYGCMDPSAPNFMPGANIQSNVPCTSNVVSGVLVWQQDYCDCLDFVYGCTDSSASNYDSTATIPCDLPGTGPGNNECCTYIIEGCMDINATTYDATATVNNPSLCEYAGCLDITATNYGMFDVNDNFTYIYGGTTYTIADITSSCISCCEYPEIPGCTDPTATNYDATATIDDGSCLYCEFGCMDPNAINYDPTATCDDGTCQYPTADCTAGNNITGAHCIDIPNSSGAFSDVRDCMDNGLVSECVTSMANGLPINTTMGAMGAHADSGMSFSSNSDYATWMLQNYPNVSVDYFYWESTHPLDLASNSGLSNCYNGAPHYVLNGGIVRHLTVIRVAFANNPGQNPPPPYSDQSFNTWTQTISWLNANGCPSVNAGMGDVFTINQELLTCYGTFTAPLWPANVVPQMASISLMSDHCECHCADSVPCIPGCTDLTQVAGWTLAECDDGVSCGSPSQANFLILAGANGDTSLTVGGCTDASASNYDPTAYVNDGSCLP